VELESSVVRSAAGLVDLGPIVKLSVTAPDVAARLAQIGLRGEVGAIASGTLAGISVDAWFLAPDEALLMHPPADPSDPAAPAPAAAALRSACFSPVDLSSGIGVLVLVGPNAREVLGDCFPVDVHARALPDRHLTSGPIAGIRTRVGRLDRGGLTSFTMLVGRDLAASLWTTLLEVGEVHGLRPVGAHALPADTS
jgi:heterotetrameric sarcosine oxidase gamma subunit